jgi:hypothetical protein
LCERIELLRLVSLRRDGFELDFDTRHEENTLRRIGFGTEGELDAGHIDRLCQLALIELSEGLWRPTAVGRLRGASSAPPDGLLALTAGRSAAGSFSGSPLR